MKVAIYTQKTDLDTFFYLSKFISELDERTVTPVLHAEIAMQFS